MQSDLTLAGVPNLTKPLEKRFQPGNGVGSVRVRVKVRIVVRVVVRDWAVVIL